VVVGWEVLSRAVGCWVGARVVVVGWWVPLGGIRGGGCWGVSWSRFHDRDD